MTALSAATLFLLLFSARPTPALAACVNAQCADTAAIEQARAAIQASCGCTDGAQSHRTYTRCAKKALKLPDLTGLIPQKACRKLIMRCEKASICGSPGGAVCCIVKGSGEHKASIVGNPAKCKRGTACDASLGLFSKFDACAPEGGCAGPRTITTSTVVPTSSTSTTLPLSGGGIVKGALPSTPGRFNYALKVGLPGADSACNTTFPGTHACTYPELQAGEAAGDLAGLKDTASKTVTSFWAIDPSLPPLEQCQDDVVGGSGLNWEYGTAHTGSRGRHVDLNNAAGTLGALSAIEQCNFSSRWVGCCQ